MNMPTGIVSFEGQIIAMAERRKKPKTEDKQWPEPLGAPAYQGVIGEYVRAVEPHTESDSAAILIQTLVCLGNAMGREPHFTVEDTRHGTNLFCVIVGATASARKGTGLARARKLAQAADPVWGAANDGEGGLSTAEGLIHHVRDPRQTNDGGTDKGAAEKRLLAAMGEFGETLLKMKRDGNALSTTLRNAWDGHTLRLRTKSSPIEATGAHISVIGHLTEADKEMLLNTAEIFNGFGNRFLWVMSKKSKSLPYGGEFRIEDHPKLVAKAQRAMDWASRQTKPIEFDADTHKRWPALYEELGKSAEGSYGAITERSQPYVRRIALVYAVMDRSPKVKIAHLRAAVEVWRYCEESAEYLFGGETDNPLSARILKFLRRRREWTSKSAIAKHVNDPGSYRLSPALDALVERGLLESREVKTAGRPRHDYRAVQEEE